RTPILFWKSQKKETIIFPFRVCGKTGSAEVSDNKEVETNAWFTGFIDDEDHPYAISVVIEKGGAGARMPSELAAKALERAVTYIG
ncbi:MAG: hypothetical protein IJH38_04060, partial [Clostridia bacterium]|nr:hypothetical protein [Clostridia bacterium]